MEARKDGHWVNIGRILRDGRGATRCAILDQGFWRAQAGQVGGHVASSAGQHPESRRVRWHGWAVRESRWRWGSWCTCGAGREGDESHVLRGCAWGSRSARDCAPSPPSKCGRFASSLSADVARGYHRPRSPAAALSLQLVCTDECTGACACHVAGWVADVAAVCSGVTEVQGGTVFHARTRPGFLFCSPRPCDDVCTRHALPSRTRRRFPPWISASALLFPRNFALASCSAPPVTHSLLHSNTSQASLASPHHLAPPAMSAGAPSASQRFKMRVGLAKKKPQRQSSIRRTPSTAATPPRAATSKPVDPVAAPRAQNDSVGPAPSAQVVSVLSPPPDGNGVTLDPCVPFYSLRPPNRRPTLYIPAARRRVRVSHRHAMDTHRVPFAQVREQAACRCQQTVRHTLFPSHRTADPRSDPHYRLRSGPRAPCAPPCKPVSPAHTRTELTAHRTAARRPRSSRRPSSRRRNPPASSARSAASSARSAPRPRPPTRSRPRPRTAQACTRRRSRTRSRPRRGRTPCARAGCCPRATSRTSRPPRTAAWGSWRRATGRATRMRGRRRARSSRCGARCRRAAGTARRARRAGASRSLERRRRAGLRKVLRQPIRL
ncbi:hypothetical protein FA95DRAFT_511369 [Auriscalpium vulgare]|uniref:Uncharacterized protein n=1 Tax=Auriscalpium vulgare TaxID=40419 RepID=A0ACB8RG28_9AGAM|nr:hypothetical protein FA95DRAFT_511369 [Auriscalpium vulgare]